MIEYYVTQEPENSQTPHGGCLRVESSSNQASSKGCFWLHHRWTMMTLINHSHNDPQFKITPFILLSIGLFSKCIYDLICIKKQWIKVTMGLFVVCLCCTNTVALVWAIPSQFGKKLCMRSKTKRTVLLWIKFGHVCWYTYVLFLSYRDFFWWI